MTTLINVQRNDRLLQNITRLNMATNGVNRD